MPEHSMPPSLDQFETTSPVRGPFAAVDFYAAIALDFLSSTFSLCRAGGIVGSDLHETAAARTEAQQ
jgi:hypothetical protein